MNNKNGKWGIWLLGLNGWAQTSNGIIYRYNTFKEAEIDANLFYFYPKSQIRRFDGTQGKFFLRPEVLNSLRYIVPTFAFFSDKARKEYYQDGKKLKNYERPRP